MSAIEPKAPCCAACGSSTAFVRYSRIAQRCIVAWCKHCRRPVVESGKAFHEPSEFLPATLSAMHELPAARSDRVSQLSILQVVEEYESADRALRRAV